MAFSKSHQVAFFSSFFPQVTLKKKALQALEHTRHPGAARHSEVRVEGGSWGPAFIGVKLGDLGGEAHSFLVNLKQKGKHLKLREEREKASNPNGQLPKSRCIPGSLPGSGGLCHQSLSRAPAS